jgi:predicted DNA-binding protein
MSNENKDQRVNIRLVEADKQALEKIAERLDRPASQIARDAIRQKIAELRDAPEVAAA